MKEKLRFVILFVGALSALATASAGNPFGGLFGCPVPDVPDCIGKWCCDDYCPKKEPCVCVPLCFQCDDYCAKKTPCVCVPLCFGCDDYRKKCLPRVCSPPRCEDLRCGPTGGCTSCGGISCDGRLVGTVDTIQATPVAAPKGIADASKQADEVAPEMPVRLPSVFVTKLPPSLTQ